MELTSLAQEKFNSLGKEIAFLRERVKEYAGKTPEALRANPEPHAAKALGEYKEAKKENVLAEEYKMPEGREESIVLKLSPESHDSKIEELLSIMMEHGVKNTLSVLERMNDPHLDDDFHRFLVQYLAAGNAVSGLSQKGEIFRGVNMKLFRIAVPRGGEVKNIREFISQMEQFYAGMLYVADSDKPEPGKNYFTLELALPSESPELALYAAVERDKASLFEKQFLAFYPDARLTETTDDYNIFVDGGASLGAKALLLTSAAFPIKTYGEFEHDPMDSLISAFSKIAKKGEGAALQLVVAPAGDYLMKRYGKVLDELDRGVPIKDALPAEGIIDEFAKIGNDLFFGSKKKEGINTQAETAKTRIKEKIGSSITYAGIRIAVSSGSVERSKEILSQIASSFNQLRLPEGNGITFEIKEGRAALKLFHEFSYRLFSENDSFPLNLKELATILHVPSQIGGGAALLEATWKTAKAPANIPSEGIILGVNRHQGFATDIRIAPEDRMRHFYVIGQTGTGKTTLLKQMIIQDIENGHGVCLIDPHGADVEDVLAHIPESRAGDVIYFNPGDTDRPMGLNMLEYDPRYPEQKTFLVNELISIFNKLFDMKVAGGPAFEQYFRNSTFLVMDDPGSGNTLLDIARVLSDKEFRAMKLSRCKNPLVVQFWQNAEKTTGEQGLANFVPYITNKFDVFLSNDIMRPIVAQEKSAFSFRDIMDQKKILLVNLSKGRLGEINSSLLGLIIVGKFSMAALSRADVVSMGKRPEDFFLYIDEFQNVTTNSIATIFSEARKYRLSLTVAHQYIAQLPDEIRQSVFGNVGSRAAFRVGQEDAEFMEKQFLPVFSAKDIVSLSNRNAYVKILINGEPALPFNIETMAFPPGDAERAMKIRDVSRAKYGKPLSEIEASIAAKFRKTPHDAGK